MTDLVTGWTENASIRNNPSKWIVKAVAALQGMFPFPLLVFDSDYADIVIMPTLLRQPLSLAAVSQ